MNYYDILNIDQGASLKDIKKAYRKLALQHHPDKNNNSEESTETFKQISIAYQVLSDPIQRSFYDNTGQTDANMDFISSLDLFKFFFKNYNPKIFNIIEKTYDRVSDKLNENDNQSFLDIIYSIEKKDIIKDTSNLVFDYFNDYIQNYYNNTKSNDLKTHTYLFEDLSTSPLTNIILPIEYFMDNHIIQINIMIDKKSIPLQLNTQFINHTITIKQNKFIFKLIDQPNPMYTRINQYNILMSIKIGLQDYLEGFQFSYNYMNTFIDKPILLSKYSSCIVIFEHLGLPKKKQNKNTHGHLIIEFNIQKDIDRLFKEPISNDYIYSVSLNQIL